MLPQELEMYNIHITHNIQQKLEVDNDNYTTNIKYM